jgi:hypothetical protein
VAAWDGLDREPLTPYLDVGFGYAGETPGPQKPHLSARVSST